MMLKVGITGGIGSGKSVVCKVLQTLGYPVFDADSESKSLLTDPKIRSAVVHLLGPSAYLPSGEPDRQWIASAIFPDARLLEQVNGILHPAVLEKFNTWIDEHHTAPLIFKEAAIMFESGSHRHLDLVVGVKAPESLRIKRVMQRDGKTEQAVRNIMQRQLPQDEMAKKCQELLVNDEQTPLLPQILALVGKLLTYKSNLK